MRLLILNWFILCIHFPNTIHTPAYVKGAHSTGCFSSPTHFSLSRNHNTILNCRLHGVIWGRAVAQLVEVLRYKPEGHGVDSASNRNEYQQYFLGVKAAGA